VSFLLSLVGCYLRVFGLLFEDGPSWRREADLTLGSIRYLFQGYLQDGASPRRAFARSLWDHWGELLPTAMFERRRLVAQSSGLVTTSARIPLLTLGLTLLAVVWTLGLLVCCLVLVFVLWPQQRR
jgi:hypothetical protein